MLFVRKSEDPSGLYDQIFTESTSREWILLPFRVQQYVGERKRVYMRELKSVLEQSKTGKAAVKDRRITARQWLKFADQLIVGAVRLYWESYLDLGKVKSQRALLSPDSFQAAVEAAYELSLRDLSPFFRNKVLEGSEMNPLTPPTSSREIGMKCRNGLKTSWSMRQTAIRSPASRPLRRRCSGGNQQIITQATLEQAITAVQTRSG